MNYILQKNIKKRVINFITFSILILISVNAHGQSKVQKLYESEKYLKCVSTCSRNIKIGKDKLNSYYYKSLSIAELNNNDKIKDLYSDPVSEALKGISKLEKYKKNNPSDYFYSEHRYGIDKIKRYAIKTANTAHKAGNTKYAKKIYRKLRSIYPDNNLYLYEYSKLFGFNSKEILKTEETLGENDYHKKIYEVLDNCKKYFGSNAEEEMLSALEIMFNEPGECDLQTASTILVLFPDKFDINDKFKKISEKFAEKYWQIDMLFEVNNRRAKGYACDKILIEPRPPVILSNCLCRTAQKYAEYMKKEDFFSHFGKDGTNPWDRAAAEGCSADAENIALNYTTEPSVVVNRWMHSKGHCKNIMGFHKEAGFGNAGDYWVQMFK